MKLPAPLVRSWNDLQLNFDAIQLRLKFGTLRVVANAVSAVLDLDVQIGSFATAALPNGNNVVLVTLPKPWATQHVAFFALPQPTTTAFSVSQWYGGIPGGTSLAQGFLHIVNGAGAQQFLVLWISFGR